nr:n amino acid transport system protein [Quercus suber]
MVLIHGLTGLDRSPDAALAVSLVSPSSRLDAVPPSSIAHQNFRRPRQSFQDLLPAFDSPVVIAQSGPRGRCRIRRCQGSARRSGGGAKSFWTRRRRLLARSASSTPCDDHDARTWFTQLVASNPPDHISEHTRFHRASLLSRPAISLSVADLPSTPHRIMSTFPTYATDDKVAHVVADVEAVDSDGSSSVNTITALVAEDHQHDIKLRTMSWQKAAWLLAGDQVCLAIMAQTWSLSVLGWVPGIITMLVAGALFWITSITMHKYIMKHPQIMDICDFGYYIFGKSKIAYAFTSFMLLANNILLIGFHVLTGAKVLNTLSDHSMCTVIFSVIVTLIGIVMSMPRTLKHVSFMSMGSGKSLLLE